MLNLACQELDGIEACAIELENNEPSYSAVTVARLRSAIPSRTLLGCWGKMRGWVLSTGTTRERCWITPIY